MRKRFLIATFTAVLLLLAPGVGLAGDSLIGTVTSVRRADLVILDYGRGEYAIRLIGIDPPKNDTLSERARQFVAGLVLGKKARMRFEYRTPNGEMVSRLLTVDTTTSIRDVGLELVRAGLAQRQPSYDYKYGELSLAEAEARRAQRGMWSATIR